MNGKVFSSSFSGDNSLRGSWEGYIQQVCTQKSNEENVSRVPLWIFVFVCVCEESCPKLHFDIQYLHMIRLICVTFLSRKSNTVSEEGREWHDRAAFRSDQLHHFPDVQYALQIQTNPIHDSNWIYYLFLYSTAALPEVILRNCRNCSPQQAQNAQKLTNFLQTRYPDVWAMLIRKYRGV